MAAIILPEGYAGTGLNVVGHNENIYSWTGAESLMGEPNGGIGTANFHADFRIQREHILPREALRGHSTESRQPVDFFASAFGSDNNEFYGMHGVGTRFHIPWTPNGIFYMWQAFVVPWRAATKAEAEEPVLASGPVMTLQTKVNGSAVAFLERQLPETVFADESVAAPNNTIDEYTGRGCYWYNLGYIDPSPSSGNKYIQAQLYMSRENTTLTLTRDILGTVDEFPLTLWGRVSLGIRGAMALVW